MAIESSKILRSHHFVQAEGGHVNRMFGSRIRSGYFVQVAYPQGFQVLVPSNGSQAYFQTQPSEAGHQFLLLGCFPC